MEFSIWLFGLRVPRSRLAPWLLAGARVAAGYELRDFSGASPGSGTITGKVDQRAHRGGGLISWERAFPLAQIP